MTLNVGGLFKNVGHFFATAIQKFLGVEPKIEAVATQVENAAPAVEAGEALIPVYGPAAVTITKAGVMALGALVGVIHSLGDAAEQKLLDVGLDTVAVQTAVDVYKNLPGQIKQLVAPAPAAPPAA